MSASTIALWAGIAVLWVVLGMISLFYIDNELSGGKYSEEFVNQVVGLGFLIYIGISLVAVGLYL